MTGALESGGARLGTGLDPVGRLGWRVAAGWSGLRRVLLAASYLAGWALAWGGAGIAYTEVRPGLWHANVRVREEPWSVHVVRVDRSRKEYWLGTTLARGTVMGLNPMSQQLRLLPADGGRAVAAINGDFFRTESEPGAGDPRGMQICRGELVSLPARSPVFWLDAARQPQLTNVAVQIRVTWPDGQSSGLGLNEEGSMNGLVLLTPTYGAATDGDAAMEWVLERGDEGAWLPLRIGQRLVARVRQVRGRGDNPIPKGTLVLVAGARAATRFAGVGVGAMLKLSVSSVPDMTGVEAAIGGGPILLRDGRVQPANVNKAYDRHPRSAVGWNAKDLFLVEVDGRQPWLSMGMTLPELTAFLSEIGCRDAMNLDGGASAEMWVDGRIASSPCFGRERLTANSLVVLMK